MLTVMLAEAKEAPKVSEAVPTLTPCATRPLIFITEVLLLPNDTRLDKSITSKTVEPSRVTPPYAVRYVFSKSQPRERSCERVAFK